MVVQYFKAGAPGSHYNFHVFSTSRLCGSPSGDAHVVVLIGEISHVLGVAQYRTQKILREK